MHEPHARVEIPEGWNATTIQPGTPEMAELSQRHRVAGDDTFDETVARLVLQHAHPGIPGEAIIIAIPVPSLIPEDAEQHLGQHLYELVGDDRLPSSLVDEAWTIVKAAAARVRAQYVEHREATDKYLDDLHAAIAKQIALAGGQPSWSSTNGWHAYIVEQLDDKSKIALLRLQPGLPDDLLEAKWVLFTNPAHDHRCGGVVPLPDGDLTEAIDHYRAVTRHALDAVGPGCTVDGNESLVEFLEYLNSDGGV